MTPEMALKHEWLQSSSSASAAVLQQPELRRSPSDTTASVPAPQQAYSMYRLYRGKKCVSKVIEPEQPDSGKTKLSAASLVAALDPSLDDSGTFLPPIL